MHNLLKKISLAFFFFLSYAGLMAQSPEWVTNLNNNNSFLVNVEGRLEFISNLVVRAKALDPSRLLTAALENHMTENGTKMIDDLLGVKLDVIGNNN